MSVHPVMEGAGIPSCPLPYVRCHVTPQAVCCAEPSEQRLCCLALPGDLLANERRYVAESPT